MNLRGMFITSTPGYDEPGIAGVCRTCRHTPTKHYRLTWLDKILKVAKSSQYCTAQDNGENPSGYPERCMCSDSYHRRHFL